MSSLSIVNLSQEGVVYKPLHSPQKNIIDTKTKIIKIVAITFIALGAVAASVFFTPSLAAAVLSVSLLSSVNILGSISIGISVFGLGLYLIGGRGKKSIAYSDLPSVQKIIHEEKRVSINEMKKTLKVYNSLFARERPQDYIGFIQKENVQTDTEVFVHADYHGQYDTLERNLKNLQQNGYLDENFKVKPEKKGKFKIVLLGDYLDRGPQSWDVFRLALHLKMENPEDVILLKGNHEDRSLSQNYIHREERHFYDNREFCKELDKTFDSLPLSCLMGNSSDYVMFAHGLFDIDIDYSDFLNQDKKEMWISKNKKYALSDRVKKLSELNPRVASEQQKKMIEAAAKVNLFASNFKDQISQERKNRISGFTWGDIKDYNWLGRRGVAVLDLNPSFVDECLRVNSGGRIKALVRGHQHDHEVNSVTYDNNERIHGVIHTLPLRGKVNPGVGENIDVSYLLKVKPSVQDWELRQLNIDQEGKYRSRRQRFYGHELSVLTSVIYNSLDWVGRVLGRAG